MTPLTKSRSGVLLDGQAPPRVRHAPHVRANSWEDVSDLLASFGVLLDEWQENVLEAAMGERSDGRWAARQVGVSTPRQNGKSQLIVARALAGVLLFDEQLIICSAHQQDTAREVFTRLVDILEDHPTLNARVDSYGKALNREYIRFRSGQTIRFKARSAGGGRGFSADCLLLDEAQILSAAAWSAILPTMSARPNPQVWLLGTPPTAEDDGEVFGRLRNAGIVGRDSRLAYLEWSADEGDDLDDPVTWAKANPAFGTRIGHEAIESERSSMTDDQFAMERLGMWSGAGRHRVIDEESWSAVADASSVAFDRLTLAVDVAPNRSTASVSLAGQRADGLWHVELDQQRKGVDWVPGWVEQRAARNRLHAVVLDEMSGLVDVDKRGTRFLRGTKVRVTLAAAEGRDMAKACAGFFDAVMTGAVRHTDQVQVNVALSVAGKRPVAGAWAWNRRDEDSDITPVVSQTLALWGARNDIVKRPQRRPGGRTAVLL